MTEKKKKRRGSQIFQFEQTEDTLLNNEKLVNLYQNKDYRAPDPDAELEMLMEELDGGGLGNKRGRGDGSLVIGKDKGRRVLNMNYKYWKQDDKERLKRRKTMITKLWKGRKKVKTVSLSEELEQKLFWLIETKEMSEEEDSDKEEELDCVLKNLTAAARKISFLTTDSCQDTSRKLRRSEYKSLVRPNDKDDSDLNVPDCRRLSEDGNRNKSCSDGATEDSFLEFIKNKELVVDTGSSDSDRETETELIVNVGVLKDMVPSINVQVKDKEMVVETVDSERDKSESGVGIKGKEGVIKAPDEVDTKLIKTEANSNVRGTHEENKSLKEVVSKETSDTATDDTRDDIVASLAGVISAGELADLLDCDDLWFCSRPKGDQKSRQSSRRSVRRSSRLMGNQMQGSVFMEEDTQSGKPAGTIQSLSDGDTKENEPSIPPLKISNRRKKTRKRRPLDVIQDQLLEDLSNLTVDEVKSTGVPVTVDDATVKTSGVPDIIVTEDISRPEGMETPVKETPRVVEDYSGRMTRRRSSVLGSSYGEMNISLPPAVRRSFSPSRLSLSPSKAGGGKNALFSDSDEELISGIFGVKTLGPRYRKEKDDQNKAFIL